MENKFYTYPRESFVTKIAYSITEVRDILGITLVKTYSLLQSKPFPMVMAVKTRIIPIATFHEWVKQNYPQIELPEFYEIPSILVYEKKSYSIPEIRTMLGMKKTSSYELIKTGVLDTIVVNNQIRVKRDCFNAWFHSQDDLTQGERK